MEELFTQPDLKGAALMSRLRVIMPGAAINDVLDAARLVSVHHEATRIRSRQFTNVLDLFEHLATLDVTKEDMSELVRILDPDLSPGALYPLILKMKKAPEPVSGCFTWAWRLGNRKTLHRPDPC